MIQFVLIFFVIFIVSYLVTIKFGKSFKFNLFISAVFILVFVFINARILKIIRQKSLNLYTDYTETTDPLSIPSVAASHNLIKLAERTPLYLAVGALASYIGTRLALKNGEHL